MVDLCPGDPNKTAPGNCGCGNPETPGCGRGGTGAGVPALNGTWAIKARISLSDPANPTPVFANENTTVGISGGQPASIDGTPAGQETHDTLPTTPPIPVTGSATGTLQAN